MIIPDPIDGVTPKDVDVLRHVRLSGTEYRLLTWDTGSPYRKGPQWGVGYAFYPPGATEPLFSGEDYGCSPLHAIDSDECLRGLLGFLTLRPGDTDSEYFDSYTPEQLAWAESEAEALSMYADEEASQSDDWEAFEEIESE